MSTPLDELTNKVMDNYDVYDLPSVETRYIRDTIELMMNNWKGVNETYKEWRVTKALEYVNKEIKPNA